MLDDLQDEVGSDEYTLSSGFFKKPLIPFNTIYSGFESFRLDASGNDDLIRMTGSFNGPHVINASDTIDIEGNFVNTFVSVSTGSGADQVILNDDEAGAVGVELTDTIDDLARLEMFAGSRLRLPDGLNRVLRVQDIGTGLHGIIDLNQGSFIRATNPIESYYRDRLTTGYNNGTWATNTAPAFVSTAANTSAASDGLGYGCGSQIGINSISGVLLAAADLVVRYTLNGDLNLDRTVNFNDLLPLNQNYGAVGTSNWVRGDFNYDDNTNFNDLMPLSQNYGASVVIGSVANQSPLLASLTEDELVI